MMPDSAKEKYRVSADYTFPDVLGGDIWLRWDTFYQGPMYSALWRAEQANPNAPPDSDGDPVYVPGSVENVDSYSKSNFQIGYASGDNGWSATLMVRNLFDDRANTFTGTGTQGYAEYWGHTGFGATNTLARPRTISFKLTKNF